MGITASLNAIDWVNFNRAMSFPFSAEETSYCS
jgi:hypothetical protein